MKLHQIPFIMVTASFALAQPESNAQTTVATEPVGFVTTTIKASTLAGVPATTPISPALLVLSGVTGSTTGQLSSVAASEVTVSTAGWTVSELSNNYAYVLFKSGALNGLILRVTANTATAATLDTLGASLVTLGAAAGDSFQLVQGDTLLSMFGTTTDGVVGGTQTQYNAGQTDRVTTRDTTGTTRTYYYNTDSSQWRRVGSSSNQGAVPISPLSGVFYSRIGNTAINQVSTGNVPVAAVKFLVPTSGNTYFARYFPSDGTINNFGFQALSGWKGTNTPGVTTTTADKVVTTDTSGVIRQYYWNGTKWLRVGSSTDQGNVSVPVGGCVYIVRSGSGTPSLLNVALPYTL
ncbi:MAG: hypothetical protein JHC52_07650 [Chthoniobacterales bacterium]|nr:hypothetical protein [Chthoniobacterales bacterium]